MKVLIIEDVSAFADLLKQILENEGHMVSVAFDLVSAFAYLTAILEPPGAIVVDLKLPGSPIGATVLRLPELSACCQRLIAMTGYPVDPQVIIAAGATAFLQKGTGMEFFRDLVAALNGHGSPWTQPQQE